jgi:hypothetical protein
MTSWLTRLAAALFILWSAALYSYFCTPKVFPAYYFEVGTFDCFMVCALPLLGNNAVIRDLQKINFCAVAIHGFGFVIYMLYFPPAAYNAALVGLKVLEWTRLLMVRHDDNLPGNCFRLDLVFDALIRRTYPTVKEAT